MTSPGVVCCDGPRYELFDFVVGCIKVVSEAGTEGRDGEVHPLEEPLPDDGFVS